MSDYRTAVTRTWSAILRDEAAKSTLFGAVILYSFFYPASYRQQVSSGQPVVIVDYDRSAASRELIRNVLAVRSVRVVASVRSLAEAQSMVSRDDARAILMIDHGFERGILRGTQARVALLGNGAMLSHAATALGGLGDAVGGFVRARFSSGPPAFEIIQRPLFNTREGYGSAVVPGVAVLIVHQTLVIAMLLLIATRREAGEIALSAPTLFGVMSVFVAVGVINLLYYNGIVLWIQDYPRGGNTTGMFLATILFVSATVSFGMFLGYFFRVRERALEIVGLTSLPLFFLANTSWPKPATPRLLTMFARVLPTTAGINAMVKLNQMGASISETSSELLTLTALAIIYTVLSMWLYRVKPSPPPVDPS